MTRRARNEPRDGEARHAGLGRFDSVGPVENGPATSSYLVGACGAGFTTSACGAAVTGACGAAYT